MTSPNQTQIEHDEMIAMSLQEVERGDNPCDINAHTPERPLRMVSMLPALHSITFSLHQQQNDDQEFKVAALRKVSNTLLTNNLVSDFFQAAELQQEAVRCMWRLPAPVLTCSQAIAIKKARKSKLLAALDEVRLVTDRSQFGNNTYAGDTGTDSTDPDNAPLPDAEEQDTCSLSYAAQSLHIHLHQAQERRRPRGGPAQEEIQTAPGSHVYTFFCPFGA